MSEGVWGGAVCMGADVGEVCYGVRVLLRSPMRCVEARGCVFLVSSPLVLCGHRLQVCCFSQPDSKLWDPSVSAPLEPGVPGACRHVQL